MTEKQYSAGEKSNPYLHLYDLPKNVLEIICQLLIDYASVCPLRDVMRLRASCSTLNDVIKDMVIYMPCYIPDRDNVGLLSQTPNYFNFIDFMRTETNWHFRSLAIDAKKIRDNDLIPFFEQNAKLFLKSLKNVEILYIIPDYYEPITDELLCWLNRFALRDNADVQIRIDTSNFAILRTELVTKVFVGMIEEEGPYPVQLFGFSNLTELSLNYELEVEKLRAFPNLKRLNVYNLIHSNVNNTSRVPKFETIKSLIIFPPRTINAEQLPSIITNFLPCLVYFFYGGSESVEFPSLPGTCQFLHINLSSLRYFAKNKHIKNMDILFDVDLASVRNHLNFAFAFCEVSVLRITLGATLNELVALISDIFMIFRSLEVLSLSLCDAKDASIKKLLEGDLDVDLQNFLRFQTELGELCNDSNLQLLVLGKTALMRKSASPALLKKIDNLEWSMRCGPGVVLPMELLNKN